MLVISVRLGWGRTVWLVFKIKNHFNSHILIDLICTERGRKNQQYGNTDISFGPPPQSVYECGALPRWDEGHHHKWPCEGAQDASPQMAGEQRVHTINSFNKNQK